MTTGGRWTGSPGEDELLSRLYQHVTQQQAGRFAAGYDITAGLDRYRAWLREHTAEDQARREASPASAVMARPATAVTDTASAAPGPGQAAAAGRTTREPARTRRQIAAALTSSDADHAVTTLYCTHYQPLVRLAVLLVNDITTAEDIVQASFAAMHAAWPRLASSDRALSYLRQSVVNRSRSVPRHRPGAGKPAPDPRGDEPEDTAQAGRPALIQVLQTLPARQREALVLRFYAGLSEAQTASTMGISTSAVSKYTVQALPSLRAALPEMNDTAPPNRRPADTTHASQPGQSPA
jgi:RNA polymerase sigma-70 factor (sigma-E family)